ncbi:hypothetical protein ACFWGI_35710 [Streptomyces niveus]|uniref:hypothetical protein n=1 Tax=Streptomyces niveus TaxID=193462 RepID=UPI00365A7690
MTKTQPWKIIEMPLREEARRQGFILRRSPSRDPRALDYGLYHLVDASTEAVVVGGVLTSYSMTLENVEEYLGNGGDMAGSISAPPLVAGEAIDDRVVRLEDALPPSLRIKAVAEIIKSSGDALERTLLAWEYRAWPVPERRAALDAHLKTAAADPR